MKKYLLLLFVAVISAQLSTAQNAILDHAVATRAEAPQDAGDKALPPLGYGGLAGVEVYAPGPFGNTSFGFTTTHGAMLTNRHFLGAGIGVMRDFDRKRTTVPLYAEGRIYFPSSQNRIYPNIALRAGAMLAGKLGTGFYGTLSGGVRIPIGNRLAILGEVGPQLTTKYSKDGPGKPFRSNGSNIGFYARISLMF